MAKSNSSIEEQVEDWAKRQLADAHVKFFTKTEPINSEIQAALEKAPSKGGGAGRNYPDIKVLITTSTLRRIPVMLEVKGTKGKLVKLTDSNEVANYKKDGAPNYSNITGFAVNGAVHYARAILDLTESYNEVLAIGINGYDQNHKRVYEVEIWYLSKENLFVPKLLGRYKDLSLLFPEHECELLSSIEHIGLTEEEVEREKTKLENSIELKLKELNQKIFDDKELKIVVGQRVQLVAGLVMAGLGVRYKVDPLRVEELRGLSGEYTNDGFLVMNRIKEYLQAKSLPKEKIDMIEGVLNVVFLHSDLHKQINEKGESKLHVLYADVKHNIIPFLTGELHNIDFTGRLFNEMNRWVDVPDGDKNDVVLTPRYVTELMAKLCQVNMDSYVWDFATGSAGFLISAMQQMIADAKIKLANSPEELDKRISRIKMEQLLGIEKLPDVYMLAVLNMILMKDGSANIIKSNSLTEFNGCYEQGKHKDEEFPANVFLLNPPYSAPGKGMIFVEKALSMMSRGGMAAVLIQENAGSGNAIEYTAEILKKNTLIASIHMGDIFSGKASVQTAIYVFRVGEPHAEQKVVRFIDFSNDGWTRSNRRRSGQDTNLRNTDHAPERYQEVINLVTYGRGINDEYLHYYKDCYIEDHISLRGDDWTYTQHKTISPIATEDNFRKTIKDYLSWKVSTILKNKETENFQ